MKRYCLALDLIDDPSLIARIGIKPKMDGLKSGKVFSIQELKTCRFIKPETAYS
jgi:hypothetical protein